MVKKAVNMLLRTVIDLKLACNLPHDNLNCFTMLDTFSKRCWSCIEPRVWLEMTRNVLSSKSTTSSASHSVQIHSSWLDSLSMFGIIEFTMVDQALYSVSSQIDVGKHW